MQKTPMIPKRTTGRIPRAAGGRNAGPRAAAEIPAAPKPAPTIWPDGGIGHPCGHESSFFDGCRATDVFGCPTCGLRWRVVTGPPILHPSGWVEPGKRTVVIDEQMDLPRLSP